VNVCTIIAKNYLAQARVLAASFKRHHPDGECFVLVIDGTDGYVDVADEPFVVVRPSEIGAEAFEQMRSAYSAMELSTALKPWLLRYMLAEHDDGSGVAYLDPDVEVHSRMVELEAALREHAVVLTPHVLRAMPRDGKRPSETDILLAGVYNLGFIGMSGREDAHTVLDWWAERLLTDCYVAPERGYFVDQRWIDFVPGLIGDLKILRHPAYNVAYWNVQERELRRDGTRRYLVDDRPLRFFHFSGYRPTERAMLSLHQSRTELTEHAALHALHDAYGDALEAAGYGELSSLPYEHGALPSGAPLTDLLRSLYRRAVEQEVALGSIFTPAGEAAFMGWLVEPDEDAPGLTRFLHGAWLARVDLRRAFPGADAGDVARYLEWLATGGADQFEAPAELLVGLERAAAASPEPAAALVAPSTAVVVAPVTAVVATAAPPEPPPLPDVADGRAAGVNVVGYLRSELGVGEIARQLIGALDAVGVPAAPANLVAPLSRQGHAYAAAARARNPFPVNLICANADVLPQLAGELGEDFFADRYNIGVWWWETSEFPAAFHGSFGLLDEVWVGSRFIAETLRAVSPIPVIQMPMPAVFPEATGFAPGEQGWPDAFTFLFSWDYHSVFERKNPLAVVAAYTAAFAPGDGAALVLKCINHEHDVVNHGRLRDAVAGRPDITIIDEYLDPADKDRLMCSCDCYVSLHRSEGLGLTIAEALYHGRPVIATGYSGNLELMDDTNSHPVGYTLVPIGDRAAPYPPDGIWAEPDVGEASRLMRQVFLRPQSSAPRATKAAEDMRLRYSAAAVGTAMRRRLSEIGPAAAAPPAGILDPTTVETLNWLAHRRGRPVNPSRFGWPGAMARHLMLRLIRPYTAYQLEVNEQLTQALSTLSHHNAQTQLDLAEAHAVLAAQVRRQDRIRTSAPPRSSTPEARPASPGAGGGSSA
jgi:glycosyltransferase involved in cell wall biosynthesis